MSSVDPGSLPPLKVDPKYGAYPRWPENGVEWIRPQDIALATRLIPSPRVFRRDGEEGPYVVLHYGELQLRVKRTLWQEVKWEGFDIGDWVEVLSRGMRNEPRTGVIRNIWWLSGRDSLRYQIEQHGKLIPSWYQCDDLRHVHPTDPLQWTVYQEESLQRPSTPDQDAPTDQ